MSMGILPSSSFMPEAEKEIAVTWIVYFCAITVITINELTGGYLWLSQIDDGSLWNKTYDEMDQKMTEIGLT